MSAAKNLSDQKYGKLEVLFCEGANKHKQLVWRCVCECGKEVSVRGYCLTSGHTTSCGCIRQTNRNNAGASKRRSYSSWRCMISRCTNPKDKEYSRYAEKQVTVCDRWKEYRNFVADMGEPPPGMTLHRVDPYGNYEPSNCVWASAKEQARDRRLRLDNKTGHNGVNMYKSKFFASVTAQNKKYRAPLRDTLEEALADRKRLEEEHWK